MDEGYRDSLVRRLRTVHSMYQDACETMSLEQVNTLSHPLGLPIAFCLAHQLLIEDFSLAMAGGPTLHYNSEWRDRIEFTIDDDGKSRTIEEMRHQRIGNYDAFRELQSIVFQSTEEYVFQLPLNSFDDVIVASPYPPTIASTFSARLGGERGISRSDALESWIYQHALRHLGEIEILRSLVGLSGMTS